MWDGARAEVRWKDLAGLSQREVLNELLLSAPWLAGSVYCYSEGWIVPGLGCSFFFFLTGLRQSHGAQHYTLGLSRRGHEWVLFGLSLLMLGSMHAVQVSHLHHHRHSLEEGDHDGTVARGTWWEAVAGGPLFILNLHRQAWGLGSRLQRRWILTEVICLVALVVYAAGLWAPVGLGCHFAVMLVGECFTGFFAVWIVHHDCGDSAGRTQRGQWLNRISYNMFLHREHHLFPAVATAHLGELAMRLDSMNRGETDVREVVAF